MLIEKDCAVRLWCCDLQMQTQERMTKAAVTVKALFGVKTEVTSSIKMNWSIYSLYGNRDVPSRMKKCAENIMKYVYRRSERYRLLRSGKPISVIPPFALLSHVISSLIILA
jgi:hypothetical protein